MGFSDLDPFFSPKSVAVIGATDRPMSIGHTLMNNLAASFKGAIYPINPNRSSVLNMKAYPKILSVSGKVDLAIIATPSNTVLQIISECVIAKVKAAIIISAGFREIGVEGMELEKQILEKAKGHLRIIGPNCLGIMRPKSHLNASFAHGMAIDGNMAFISQSGALCTAVLDWSLKEKIGFSAFVSIGSMLDVGWCDLLNYFGQDPLTKTIIIYMESIGDPKAFISAAGQVSRMKPVVLLKAGRTAESAQAAISHTGALIGNDELFSAAMQSAGVFRIESIADLYGMAMMLSRQPAAKGPKLTIITNAGGPGVLATDALVQQGGKLASLSKPAVLALDAFLPPYWSHNNPIDLLGDATADTFAKAVEIVSKDPASDGTLVILTPQDMTDPTLTAERLKPHALLKKPILTSWMGGCSVERGQELLSHYQIPHFDDPEMAVRAFVSSWKNSQLFEENQTPIKKTAQPEHQFIAQAIQENRSILNQWESIHLLQSYGISTVQTEMATSARKAVKIAQNMGFPVVLKVLSQTVTHKMSMGGVKLDLKDADSVTHAYDEILASMIHVGQESHFQGVSVQPMIKLDGYELILGSKIDPQFGPVILFGMGGHFVEVISDRSLAIPPLTKMRARRMMQQTKIYRFLQDKTKIDLGHLEEVVVRFGDLVLEQPRIQECDINPLFVSPEGVFVLDARIILN